MERKLSGPYNLISPPGHTTMGALLDACAEVTGGAAELCWTDPATVLAAGIEPWTQLPVWVPPGSDLHEALHTADVSRALATGLVCRPVGDTVGDTWTWLRGIGDAAPLRPDRPPVGLDRRRRRRPSPPPASSPRPCRHTPSASGRTGV